MSLDQSPCEGGCGRIPEVYGSSWCAQCHDCLPEYTRCRILALRNTLSNISTVHSRPTLPAQAALSYCRQKAFEVLMATAETEGVKS